MGLIHGGTDCGDCIHLAVCSSWSAAAKKDFEACKLQERSDMKSPSGVVEVSELDMIELSNDQLIRWAKSVIKGHYNVGRYCNTNLKILNRDER